MGQQEPRWGRGAVYHRDELLRHIFAANGAMRIANGKEWIVCGGGRLLADLSAKSMFNASWYDRLPWVLTATSTLGNSMMTVR
jgi:hypothetical protein